MITYGVKNGKQVSFHTCPKHGKEVCQQSKRLVNIFSKLRLVKKDKHGCEKWYYKTIPFAVYLRPMWMENDKQGVYS